MEDKKLNLNQPFLSVRRHSQSVGSVKDGDHQRRRTSLIPYYKPELKSGPVGKNGTVPFHWEQTPGKAREETRRTMIDETVDKLQIAPKLPQGKDHNTTLLDSRRICQNNFENKVENVDNFEDFDCVKENKEEKKSYSNTEDDCNDDEVYEDALDTLSRTTYSTFLNCSMSGVSGLEDFDAKPCRNFSRDPNTLDLVMGRFLPAAKAVVYDMPQYIPKKPIIIKEQSREVKKIAIKKEDEPLVLRYGPSFTNRYSSHWVSEERDEEDDEDSDYDDDDHDHGGVMPSVCGLLPRFCLKGSTGILNPVPGLRVRTRVRKSYGSKVHNRSSAQCSNTVTQNEFKSESCNLKPDDNKIPTIKVEGNDETITEFKSREKVCKTFGQFLDEKESSDELDSEVIGSEKAVHVDTIPIIENQSVPNEGLRASEEDHDTDAEMNDQIRMKDFSAVDLKNLALVDFNKNSTATDNMESDLKTTEICNKKYSEFIVSPPLPKSPSDSWLWRTLPSVSTKNVYRHPNAGAQNPKAKVPVDVTKWEAIVKSSKLQHDNSHHPEELQKT